MSAKRLHGRARLPVILHAYFEILNITRRVAVQMADMGPAALHTGITDHAHPVKLAVHFR